MLDYQNSSISEKVIAKSKKLTFKIFHKKLISHKFSKNLNFAQIFQKMPKFFKNETLPYYGLQIRICLFLEVISSLYYCT